MYAQIMIWRTGTIERSFWEANMSIYVLLLLSTHILNLSMVLFVCNKCKMSATALTRINRMATNINVVKENIEKIINDMDSNSTEIKLHIDDKTTENSKKHLLKWLQRIATVLKKLM